MSADARRIASGAASCGIGRSEGLCGVCTAGLRACHTPRSPVTPHPYTLPTRRVSRNRNRLSELRRGPVRAIPIDRGKFGRETRSPALFRAERNLRLRGRRPGEDLQSIGRDDAGDAVEIGADDRRVDASAVAPVSEVPEAFLVARDLVERLAGETGVEGDIGDPPEARTVQGVDIAETQLERTEDPLSVVEPGVRPGRGRMIGDQGRVPMTIGAEEDEPLLRGRDRGRLGEDLPAAVVADDEVLLADGDDQEG